MLCLILSTDPVIEFMVEQAAAQVGSESRTAADPAEALDATRRGDADVVVLDHVPGAFDALAWSEALRRDDDERKARVIVLAGADEHLDRRRLTDAGVDDLLVKPFQAVELELRLATGYRIAELLAQVDAGTRALDARATQDPLTGVLTDRAVLEALQQEADRAGREGSPLATIVVEVDGLSVIRDWTGADAADAALVDVASRIRRTLRPYDRLGRSGPAGFLVTLPRCDMDRAVAVAERIRSAVSGSPVRSGDRMVSVTVSLGVARLEVGDANRPDHLVAAGVMALVAARAAGGNRVATPAGCV
jgi:two-component system, cell cycle response regulator